MHKVDLACKGFLSLFSSSSGAGLSVPELKIMMALRLHGKQRRRDLMVRAGFSSPNQSHLSGLVKKKLMDVVIEIRENGQGQKRYVYELNYNGHIALQKILKPITG